TDEPAAPSSDETPMPDLRPVLDAAIAWLPAKERVAVVLCHLEGLTYAAAAERLGCPLGTLAARLARARRRVPVRLTRQGPGPGRGVADGRAGCRGPGAAAGPRHGSRADGRGSGEGHDDRGRARIRSRTRARSPANHAAEHVEGDPGGAGGVRSGGHRRGC